MNKYALIVLLTTVPLALEGQNLDQEAQTQSNTFWSQRIARCGDTIYIAYKAGDIEALKNGQVKIQSRPLTETDRLNGWEWRGATVLTATATRSWSVSRGGWQDWTAGAGLGTLNASMEKRRGSWSITPDSYGPLNQTKPFSCSQVPPERFDPSAASVQDAQRDLKCQRFMAADNPWPDYQNWLRDLDVRTCKAADGRTPLMKSAAYPHVESVRYLLAMGADVNARDNAGEVAMTKVQGRLSMLRTDPPGWEKAQQVIGLLRNASSEGARGGGDARLVGTWTCRNAVDGSTQPPLTFRPDGVSSFTPPGQATQNLKYSPHGDYLGGNWGATRYRFEGQNLVFINENNGAEAGKCSRM